MILPEVRRRRSMKGSTDKAMITSDNYITHHSLEEVKQNLTLENVFTPGLIENATGSVQFCDTDLNSQLKVRQKQLQGIELYESVLENLNLELDDVPEDPKEIRTMDVSLCDRIQMPQVTRGQAHHNTLLSLAEMSYTMDGAGFYRNGQAPNDAGSPVIQYLSNLFILCTHANIIVCSFIHPGQ